MPTPPLSDDIARAAVDAFKAHGRNYLAAKALAITESTFRSRLKVAAERGMMLDHAPAMPGFRISQVTTRPDGATSIQQRPEHGEVFDIPAGLRLKGVTALVDAEGRVMHKHVMAREGSGPSATEIAEALKASFANWEPCAPITPAPAEVDDDLATLIPCNDWHVNMFSWGRETGNDWDLKIADATIGTAVESVIDRSKASGTCIILGGGDLLHVNGKNNQTVNGTPQDADSRFQKGIDVAGHLMVRTIMAALRKHKHVIVRLLKGNHDEDSSVALVYFLYAWFRNEPRVTVDTDPSLYWWYRFGSVLLGATHGHTVKAKDMPAIMAHRRAKDWGETTHRFVHCFHVHHREVLATEGQGVITEVHQAPIPQDAWHFGSGFLSGRSIQAITYHKRLGWRGGAVECIQDAEVV